MTDRALQFGVILGFTVVFEMLIIMPQINENWILTDIDRTMVIMLYLPFFLQLVYLQVLIEQWLYFLPVLLMVSMILLYIIGSKNDEENL